MEYYLRRAEKEDIDILFRWANDPGVRQNSFSTHKITYQEHEQWFQSMLASDTTVQYIYMENNKPIGQVRINMENDVAEIGYSVCAEKRSLGHGKRILQLICKQIWKDFPEITKVIGRVKSENVPSQKAFTDVGYKEVYRVYEIEKDDFI